MRDPESATSFPFDYDTAFFRNRGFISPEEQHRLRTARVAVAGLGGTGGAQVHALARLGIGKFTLADPDVFELINFNRQVGATMSTIGRSKEEVAAETILGINPEAEIRRLGGGISSETIDEFLADADVVVDSLDFYCFPERFLLYARARAKGLWVLTSPPLGFGFTFLAFDPRGMRFEDYFGFEEGMAERDLVVCLIAGISPRPYMMRYLNRDAITFAGRQLPSLGAAPFIIAGVMSAEVANVLLGKAPKVAVPTVAQFDALLHKYRLTRYPLGMRGPLQRLKRALIRRRLPV